MQRLIIWRNIQLLYTSFCLFDPLACQLLMNLYNYSYIILNKCTYRNYLRLSAVDIKVTVYWVVMPCNSAKSRCFGGTSSFFLQDWSVSQVRNQQKHAECLSPTYKALHPEDFTLGNQNRDSLKSNYGYGSWLPCSVLLPWSFRTRD
jgi:hypothetical protein